MVRTLFISVAVAVLGLACVPKRAPIEASSTIEEVPNEELPAADAGTLAAAPEKKEEPPPAPTVTFTKAEATEGFAVSMPKDPQVQRNSVELKKGKVMTVSLSSNVEGVIYSVTRAEYPEAIVKKAGTKKMLTEAREGLAKQLKGTVSDEKEALLAGHPGETFTVAGTSNMVRARSAIVANQLFSLIVVYTGKVPDKADEFLNSIELKNPPAPASK
jgi:hypothetical protein